MVRSYDDWERLVVAVMRREQFRQLSLCDSLSSSPGTLSRDSSFSLGSNNLYDIDSFSTSSSPLHPDSVKGKQIVRRTMPIKRRNPIWKGLSIFVRVIQEYGREKRELKLAEAQRTPHGLHLIETTDSLHIRQMYGEVSKTADETKRRAETERLQRLHTLKGHIQSVLKAKGIDLDSIPQHYTI